jgi:hypothetical protein
VTNDSEELLKNLQTFRSCSNLWMDQRTTMKSQK